MKRKWKSPAIYQETINSKRGLARNDNTYWSIFQMMQLALSNFAHSILYGCCFVWKMLYMVIVTKSIWKPYMKAHCKDADAKARWHWNRAVHTQEIEKKKKNLKTSQEEIITLSQWWEVSEQELAALLQLLENMGKWASI
jgi:hypothetical protein